MDTCTFEKSSPVFNITTLERLQQIIGNSRSIAKIHVADDVSIITPWLAFKAPYKDDGVDVEKGRLTIPLKEIGEYVKVFIPCGGMDPDTDELPDWCEHYNISEIIEINPTQLRQRNGDEYLSAIANEDYTVIMKQPVEEGDINRQNFGISTLPPILGKLLTLPWKHFVQHKGVLFSLVEVDKNEIGRIKITYQNACFNSLGFLTYDIDGN